MSLKQCLLFYILPVILLETTESVWGPNSYCGRREVIPKVSVLEVHSTVSNNFATTVVTTKFKNVVKESQNAAFSLILPDAAFISKFSMEIEGKKYDAYVIEKTKNMTEFNDNINRFNGSSTAHVHARDSNIFSVSITVEPKKNVTIHLTYEEFVQKRNGQYELVYNINPGQTVDHLQVEVHIDELRPLKYLKSPSIRSANQIGQDDDDGALSEAEIKFTKPDNTSAIVIFQPNIEKQKQLACSIGGNEQDGISGQFILQYDMEDTQNVSGQILVKNNYFVEFFAPKELPVLPKLVTFILDVSGSMTTANRIEQLKDAMKTILSDLRPVDTFNLLTFSSEVYMCDLQLLNCQIEANGNADAIEASTINLNKAIDSVQQLIADGGTDIDLALKMGLDLVTTQMSTLRGNNGSNFQPLTIFLTDGEPTVGITDLQTILDQYSIRRKNVKFINPLYCLSFGDGANKTLLNLLSENNQGFFKHIYDGKDAASQLENFFSLISSPLLSNVTFRFGAQQLAGITKTNFPLYFNGTELVVTGKTDEVFSAPKIIGWGAKGPVEFVPKIYRPASDLERQWAFITLKQMLKKREVETDKTEITAKIVQFALKYSFVTDFTSLIVVDPNGKRAIDIEVASSVVETDNSTNTCSSVPKPEMEEMKICTTVSNRFASTLITSNVTNSAQIRQNTTFHMALPHGAFITGFLMILDGRTYKSYIKDKHTNSNMFDKATTMRTEQGFFFDGMKTNGSNFEITVSLKANGRGYFRLVYQEFLHRKDGKYTIRVPVATKQLVNNLHVTIKIKDTNPIMTNLTVHSVKGSDREPQWFVDNYEAFINFDANLEDQRNIACSQGIEPEEGFETEIFAQYDIERESDYNHMLVRDNYFLYFFAPSENYKHSPKQIVYLMDTSSSMHGGNKFTSAKFLEYLLMKMDKTDIFNLVSFAAETKLWMPQKSTSSRIKPSMKHWKVYDDNNNLSVLPYKVQKHVIFNALKDFGILQPSGSKDIKLGIELALKCLKKGAGLYQPVIVIITDGENYNNNSTSLVNIDFNVPIFALNLSGNKKINPDLSRLCRITSGKLFNIDGTDLVNMSSYSDKIYGEFFKSNFDNVKFEHGASVRDLTEEEFHGYTVGNELVIAGQYDLFHELNRTRMNGNHQVYFKPKLVIPNESLDRIWAYLTLKGTLNKAKSHNNTHIGLMKNAQLLSNKYAFFSSVNTMAVLLDAACDGAQTTAIVGTGHSDKCVFDIQPKVHWFVTNQDDVGNHLCLTQTHVCCADLSGWVDEEAFTEPNSE